ncbi:MAG: DUF3426 domain-containing protein [Gammaproteobacteria bacterium]|nr:DUF3426 domain-containing protein [Gammaproteobacteria bacterium]
MHTRCPNCGTVFGVTAEQLKLAQGDVRCGNCSQIFSALEWLSDEENAGASEARQSVAVADDALSESTGEAAGGIDLEEEGPLEFDAPEDTWSNFFIESMPGDRNAGKTPTTDAAEDVQLDGDLESITADPDEWRAMLAEIDPPSPWGEDAAPWEGDTDQPEPGEIDVASEVTESALTESDSDAPAFTEEHAEVILSGDSVSEGGSLWIDEPANDEAAEDEWPEDIPVYVVGNEKADEFGAELEQLDELPPAWTGEAEPARPLHRGWLIGAGLLILLAVLQVVHMNRDGLATSARYGDALRAFYSFFGQQLLPNWPLDVYAVRRAEAIAGGSATNALDISAALEITGEAPVGLPLIRVSLRDQWANVVASRVFEPAEYLMEDLPDVVPGGTRIPVNISVADPGIQARGYVVDVCLPNRRLGLRCQLSRDPFVQ